MSNAEKVERLRAAAITLHRAGRLDEADKLYHRILALHATDVEARHMLGLLRLQQGRAKEALQTLDALAVANPGHVQIRTHRGLALQEVGRTQDAMADFDGALAIRPGNPTALMYRANLLLEQGRPETALEDYNHILGIVVDDAEAWFRRGSALWLLDRAEAALDSYDRALAIDPDHHRALFNSGMTLLRLNRPAEAFAAFEKAHALAPNHRLMLGGLASALLAQCDLVRWPQYQDLVTEAVRTRSAVIAPLTFLPFCDDGALRRVCSDLFVADRVAAPGQPLWTGQRYNHRRIRVAYLSADFYQHATAALIAGLVARHDRTRFEVTAISFGPDDGSALRARLREGFEHFEDVQARSDRDIARLLREREIDIAVDLKGHTEGARPGILSHQPCPVQVSFLGYPGTVAPWLDYVLGDATALPFSHQPFYHEKIVHLPHSYQPNDPDRAIADDKPSRGEAGLPQDAFVFCCFNAGWKIAPAIFDCWMRLLAAVPGSVLWLLEGNTAAPENLRVAAAARGVDPARLLFAPPVAPAAHLARHRLADLFLDTLPYNAHTTASDALWAGLPVLTQLGRQFDGRVAASLLQAVGLAELVTETVQDYEALALALARDPARLSGLRAKLTAARSSCPLFDADLFRRHLETAYERMVEISAGGAPQSFAVPA